MNKFAFPFVVSSFLVVLASACGRSTLETYDPPEVDSGTVTPPATCTPSSCPRGCCDSSGTCRAGTARDACGTFGESCDDCPREGFPLCDSVSRSCARTIEVCDETTCADGCCSLVNGSPVCLRGDGAAACGKGGESCVDCTDSGLRCDGTTGACVGVPCNAETCPTGCCLGNECFDGLTSTTCGGGAAECENCDATGRECSPNGQGGGLCTGTPRCAPDNCSGCCDGDFCLPGGDVTACGGGAQTCDVCDANEQCVLGRCEVVAGCNAATCNGCCLGDQCLPGSSTNACGAAGAECQNCAATGQDCAGQACSAPLCNAATCPDGCCDGDTCRPQTDAACGVAGGACQDCASVDLVCQSGVCITPCTPETCAGCCDGNVCEAGFLNDTCGSGGTACNDCGGQNSVCDVDALPRSCVDATDCPAAYDACPAGVSTPAPVPNDTCTAALLLNARQACSQGPTTAGCQNFFAQLAANNGTSACAQCLAPFRFPFQTGRGIANCLAPFVNASCNRATGCAADCEDRSCEQCAPVATGDCRQNVRQGQCSQYFSQVACLAPALFGAGSFCSPQGYGSYGAWLEAVGAHFCDATP